MLNINTLQRLSSIKVSSCYIRIISTGLFGEVDYLIRGVSPKHTPLYNLRRKKTEQIHLKALKPSG